MNIANIPTAFFCLTCASIVYGNTVSESQQKYIEIYESRGQEQIVAPEDALLNQDCEPDLSEGFVDLYNGKNLDGWIPLGGSCTFEANGDVIVGKVVADSASTFLSTVRDDYTDFIFTVELYWEIDNNSGIQFRSKDIKGQVLGPQVEMEGDNSRGWSGGIYGQSVAGWRYPLWLEAHETVRKALNMDEWNRVTLLCQGDTVKTWINGIPAAHWINTEFDQGFLSLQIHASKSPGEVHFRNIKLKELSHE